MAPIPTTSNQLWIHADGFDWMLYRRVKSREGQIPNSARLHFFALADLTTALTHYVADNNKE